jgi:hypothetical protein
MAKIALNLTISPDWRALMWNLMTNRSSMGNQMKPRISRQTFEDPQPPDKSRPIKRRKAIGMIGHWTFFYPSARVG